MSTGRGKRLSAGKSLALSHLVGDGLRRNLPELNRTGPTTAPPLPPQRRGRGRPSKNSKPVNVAPPRKPEEKNMPKAQTKEESDTAHEDSMQLVNADDQLVAEEQEINTSLQEDEEVEREPAPALPLKLPTRRGRPQLKFGKKSAPQEEEADYDHDVDIEKMIADAAKRDAHGEKVVEDPTQPVPPHRLSKERLTAMLRNKELPVVGPRDDPLSRSMRLRPARRVQGSMGSFEPTPKRQRWEENEPSTSQQINEPQEEVIEEEIIDEQIEEWTEDVIEEPESQKKPKSIEDYRKKKKAAEEEEIYEEEVYEEIEIEGIKEGDPRMKIVGVQEDGTAIVEMVEDEEIEYEEEVIERDVKIDDMEPLQPSLTYERPVPRRKPSRQVGQAPKRFVSHSRPTVLGLDRRGDCGIDLPDEHMPKQRAQHVLRLGLIPAVNAPEGLKNREFPTTSVSGKAQDLYQQEDGSYILTSHAEQQNLMEDVGTEAGQSTSGEKMDEGKGKSTVVYERVVGDNGMEMVFYHDEAGNELQLVDEEHVPGEEERVYTEGHVKQEMHEEKKPDTIPEVKKSDDSSQQDDEDLPPQLVPEDMHESEVPPTVAEDGDGEEDEDHQAGEMIAAENDGMLNYSMTGDLIRVASPSGIIHEVQIARDLHGNEVFFDRDGHIVELVNDIGTSLKSSTLREEEEEEEEEGVVAENSEETGQQNLREPNFNFLDQHNVCCGICGEIVPYDALLNEHLPNAHPETIQTGLHLEEVPYETWVRSRLKKEEGNVRNGVLNDGSFGAMRLLSRSLRQLRRVSQIRINPSEMSHEQLELALKRKLYEKMSRKVPVSLVDRFHAKCGICEAIVSLNRKFEVVHLVRHFNAWHPAEHRCSGAWRDQAHDQNAPKTLSLHDFAVVDTEAETNNLQCIWCGMFMDRNAIGMHFSEVHPEDVEVPRCSLCLQEMVISARLVEKFSTDFGVSMPDEFRLQVTRFPGQFNSEKALTRACLKFIKKEENPDAEDAEDVIADADLENEIITTNSRQSFGKRNRLKRSFVKPCFRQICPKNSDYLEALAPCQWKCKICNQNIFGAVISAGAIRHFKVAHPTELEKMQYELCQARLEKISDKTMTFVHPQLVECLICHMSYALHKPYNMCRAIRHLKLKHAEVMPEYVGKPINNVDFDLNEDIELRLGELIEDPFFLEKLRRTYHTEFDKAQEVFGFKNSTEPVYILLKEGESVDSALLKAITASVKEKERGEGSKDINEKRRDRQMRNEQKYLKGHSMNLEEEYTEEEEIRRTETMTTMELLKLELERESNGDETLAEVIRKRRGTRMNKGSRGAQPPPAPRPQPPQQVEQQQQQQQQEEQEEEHVYQQYDDMQIVEMEAGQEYQYMYEVMGHENVYMDEEEIRAAEERGEIRVVYDEAGEAEYIYENE